MRRPIPALFAYSLALCLASCSTTTRTVDEERQVEIHTESTVGYMNLGEYERAIDQAMRGLTLDPDNPTLRLYLSRALLKRGGTQDVLRAEQILRELDGKEDFRVPLGLAEVLERKGVAYSDAGRAIASGERFTRSPDPVVRGEELRQQALQAWNESLGSYQKADTLRPNDPEVLSGFVRVHSLLGNDEKALEYADAILVTTGTDRTIWNRQLERPNLSVGEEDRIRKILARLTDLQAAVLLQASSIAVRLKRPERAVEYLERLLEIDPDLPEAHGRRAQILIELQRYEEAIAGIDDFLRLSGLPFDHPFVQRAFELRSACELALLD
jgi:tetratricopeptide (TPR) repeat protein